MTEAGELFTWGDDCRSGCLGRGGSGPRQADEPTRVEALAGTKITSVSAGGRQTLAVAQNSSVHTFGCMEGGRVGAWDLPPDVPSDAQDAGTTGLGNGGQLTLPRRIPGLRLLM